VSVKKGRTDGAKIATLSPKAIELEQREIGFPPAPASAQGAPDEENGETRARIPGCKGSSGNESDRQMRQGKEGKQMNQQLIVGIGIAKKKFSRSKL
jgi:hypothetical protein